MAANCFEPVAVTAVSIASCLGSSMSEVRANLANSCHGLSRNHQWHDCIPAPIGPLSEAWLEDAAHVCGNIQSLTKLQLVACRLVAEVIEFSDLFKRYKPNEVGLSISTTTAGLESWFGRLMRLGADWSADNPCDYFGSLDHAGTLSDKILSMFSIRGPDVTFSTACSGGALAIARGAEMIRRGEVKACIVGGVDILTGMTMHGFNSLQVIDHDVCRPFHSERNGLNLSEGGAFFVLEKSHKEEPIAMFNGYGVATDFHHMTLPNPTGQPMGVSMSRAVASAGWLPCDVNYVNAHGTGTKANDAAELLAIESVCGTEVFFNSTKAMHGHALAGAGPLEAALTIDALESGQFFVDPRLTPAKSIVEFGSRPRRALCNSFGFGGHNVTLALSVASKGSL
ncbi:MAG: beta-ketoacyl synthase N-terminal-like domain-containing protein [Proteobacteria bacterium]|nr:beta-ketoacyl synthase N-terminal-like domain-containing protein [Pseudomonadota bacterium]